MPESLKIMESGDLVDIERFRYIARNGVGVLSTRPPEKLNRTSRVRILHHWMTLHGPNYCAEAVSDETLKYLRRLCDPRDRRVFFEWGDII